MDTEFLKYSEIFFKNPNVYLVKLLHTKSDKNEQIYSYFYVRRLLLRSLASIFLLIFEI